MARTLKRLGRDEGKYLTDNKRASALFVREEERIYEARKKGRSLRGQILCSIGAVSTARDELRLAKGKGGALFAEVV